jgi:aspartokinase/homoserine dehydrogenase 1
LVGSTLLDQIKINREKIKAESGIDLVINAVSNSRKMLLDEDGLNISNYKHDIDTIGASADLEEFIQFMFGCNFPNSIFVDNTANNTVPSNYYGILSKNIAISTPNKIAMSGSYHEYKKLKEISLSNNVQLNYETNVGAGLPIISTLNNMLNSGDKITKIEAVLSGSLSYIFNNFNSSTAFSSLVSMAKDQGFTEPDPREDLSGADVKRKLTILGRESGIPLESDHITVEPLLSESCLAAKTIDAFFSNLVKEDTQMQHLVKTAESKNHKLRFLASLENGIGKIGLNSVDEGSPFFNLNGSDNMIAFYSNRYKDSPLIIRGPGAGADVTAAGVLAEIINMGKQL